MATTLLVSFSGIIMAMIASGLCITSAIAIVLFLSNPYNNIHHSPNNGEAILSPIRRLGFVINDLNHHRDHQPNHRSLRTNMSSPLTEHNNDDDDTITASRPRRRPIMHTFYVRVGRTHMSRTADEQMLQVWKRAWEQAGWEPKVLQLQDATRHPDFQMLSDQIQQFRMDRYNKMCYYRWLAMVGAGGGWMSGMCVFLILYSVDVDVVRYSGCLYCCCCWQCTYVWPTMTKTCLLLCVCGYIDYDTLPLHNFTQDGIKLPINGAFVVWEGSYVPSLLSGSLDEWLRLTYRLIEHASEHRYHGVNDSIRSGFTLSDMHSLQEMNELYPNIFLWKQNVMGASQIPVMTSIRTSLPIVTKVDDVLSGRRQDMYQNNSPPPSLRGIISSDASTTVTKRYCQMAVPKNMRAIHFSHHFITHYWIPHGHPNDTMNDRPRIAEAWWQEWRDSCASEQ
jgi:hypothetical protein